MANTAGDRGITQLDRLPTRSDVTRGGSLPVAFPLPALGDSR
jgi:hypothetical protein